MDLTHICNVKKWIEERCASDPFAKMKLQNTHIFIKFNRALYDVKDLYNGTIVYDLNAAGNTNIKRFLYTCESTPFFQFMKLTPRSYYIRNFEIKNLWKGVEPDQNTIEYITSLKSDKYVQPETKVDFDFDYILFAMNSSVTDLKYWIKTFIWAKENKKHIVFKWHPCPYPNTSDYPSKDKDYDIFHSRMVDNNIFPNEYVHIVHDVDLNHLIDNSYAVWSTHSGAIIAAILKRKKVAYFILRYGVDYYEIAPLCKTPKQAYDSMYAVDDDTFYKFFTWYYKYVVVDVLSPNFEEMLNHRLDLYFNKKVDNIRFLLPEKYHI